MAPFLSPLLNQPLDLVRLKEVLSRSVGVGVPGLLLLLEHRELMFSDPPLQVRGALLAAAVRFLGSQNLLVHSLQVRARPYPSLRLPTTITDVIPPPVTTGTSSPAYSVFCEKDPSNPSTILQYKSITAAPAYTGTSSEVGQRNLIFASIPPPVIKSRELGITRARLSTK